MYIKTNKLVAARYPSPHIGGGGRRDTIISLISGGGRGRRYRRRCRGAEHQVTSVLSVSKVVIELLPIAYAL